MNSSPSQQNGRGLGYFLIGLFMLIQLAILLTEEPVRYLLNGLGLIYVGGLFLVSYFHEQRSFLFRSLMYFCTHIMIPRSRKSAFFLFALPTLLGMISLIAGGTVIILPMLGDV